MTRHKSIWLICNEASGSNDDTAVTQLCARLNPERVFAVPRDELPDAALLSAQGPGVLAIFTGDGTANTAIRMAEGFAGRVLVLPGGTTNLLSRSLHGDGATLDDILAAFEQGRLHDATRHLIETAQGLAHSEVLAGPGATWSDVRETMREFDVAGMARTAGEAIQQTTAGPPVLVAEPPVGSIDGYPAVLLTVVDNAMQVDGYFADDIAGLFQQGVALLTRDFRAGPHDDLGRHCAVVLRSAEPIQLMIDGERATGGQEERIVLRAADLTFLALRPAEGG